MAGGADGVPKLRLTSALPINTACALNICKGRKNNRSTKKKNNRKPKQNKTVMKFENERIPIFLRRSTNLTRVDVVYN